MPLLNGQAEACSSVGMEELGLQHTEKSPGITEGSGKLELQ